MGDHHRDATKLPVCPKRGHAGRQPTPNTNVTGSRRYCAQAPCDDSTETSPVRGCGFRTYLRVCVGNGVRAVRAGCACWGWPLPAGRLQRWLCTARPICLAEKEREKRCSFETSRVFSLIDRHLARAGGRERTGDLISVRKRGQWQGGSECWPLFPTRALDPWESPRVEWRLPPRPSRT